MRRQVGQSSDLVASSPFPYWAGCTTNTSGYDFRKGQLATAKYLINSPKPSDGYTHLYERGRLNLTVEAMVVENTKWNELFTSDELAIARLRLKQYGYKLKDGD